MPTGQSEDLVLLRGIAIPEPRCQLVADQIVREGVTGNEPGLRYRMVDVQAHAEEIFNVPERYQKLVAARERAHRVAFACGDPDGAAYYATEHNPTEQNDSGLVVEMTVSRKHCFVDSRDFLCPVFQFWDRRNEHGHACRDMLVRLYGPAILRYFERAAASKDHSVRIAMCNLAAHDPHVVSDHYENQSLISGRNGVTCRSAFGFRLPVPSDRILSVYEAEAVAPAVADVRLTDWA